VWHTPCFIIIIIIIIQFSDVTFIVSHHHKQDLATIDNNFVKTVKLHENHQNKLPQNCAYPHFIGCHTTCFTLTCYFPTIVQHSALLFLIFFVPALVGYWENTRLPVQLLETYPTIIGFFLKVGKEPTPLRRSIQRIGKTRMGWVLNFQIWNHLRRWVKFHSNRLSIKNS
jgi:hypothetical protein